MPLEMPEGAESAHPFKGGSKTGLQRIRHLIESGSMTTYKDTRNGLIGQDFSTKLSAWLALGSVTARQIHWLMVDFEDGKTDLGKPTSGYGKGENKGTAGVRFELLWRDYMRLCTKKFGTRLFMVDGYRRDGEHQDQPRLCRDAPFQRVERYALSRPGPLQFLWRLSIPATKLGFRRVGWVE